MFRLALQPPKQHITDRIRVEDGEKGQKRWLTSAGHFRCHFPPSTAMASNGSPPGTTTRNGRYQCLCVASLLNTVRQCPKRRRHDKTNPKASRGIHRQIIVVSLSLPLLFFPLYLGLFSSV